MKSILTRACLSLGLLAGAGVAAHAQTADRQEGPRAEGRRGAHTGAHGGKRFGRFGRRHGLGLRGLRGLNLTDAQKEQIRTIHQNAGAATQARREELRQLFRTRRQGGQLTAEQEARARQLRAELKEARERTHNDVLAVLTPEQRAQLEQFKQERKARREQMRERFRQKREGQPQPPSQ